MTENVSKGVVSGITGLAVGAVTETTYGGVIAVVVGAMLSACSWAILAIVSLDRRVKVIEEVTEIRMEEINRRLANIETHLGAKRR